MITPHAEVPYPHAGGCEGCRESMVCNSCGVSISRFTRCTNQRCLPCHSRYCTSGGEVSAGHGYGGRGARTIAPTHGGTTE